MNWNIQPNYIYGSNSDIVTNNNVKSIYLFDLDYTLIKTKSGKKFPVSKTDWELLFDNIPNKISNLKDCVIGIISNQKGLKSDIQIRDWIDKIVDISKLIRIDLVFASIKDDRFRKPLPGSWEFIKSNLTNIDWDKLNNLNKIYYIGDAFGREKDFSDTDIKYALNCRFKFKTPEIFFSIVAFSFSKAISKCDQ